MEIVNPFFIGKYNGRGVIIGVVWYYLFLAGTEVPTHVDPEPTETAVYEQGRPLKRAIIATGAGAAYHQESKAVGAHAVPDLEIEGFLELRRSTIVLV